MKHDSKISITLREFDFLRAYIDFESTTFANAYKSALRAGYSVAYTRVIRRHYPALRMKTLQNALKNEDLMRMIEATRHVDLGTPIKTMPELRRIIRKRERDLIGMSAEEVMHALDELLGDSI